MGGRLQVSSSDDVGWLSASPQLRIEAVESRSNHQLAWVEKAPIVDKLRRRYWYGLVHILLYALIGNCVGMLRATPRGMSVMALVQ